MAIKIGIDCDDVLTETTEAWLRRHNEMSNDNVTPEDIKSWDIAQYITKGNRDTLFSVLYQKDFWPTVEAVDDAKKYLWLLIDEHDDIDVYITTATHPETAAPKIRNLHELFPFIDDDHIVMTAAKGILDVDIMVDDNPENLCALKPGSAKLLFDRPHNQWCDEAGIGAVRVKTWKEIYDYITTIAWLESEDELED